MLTSLLKNSCRFAQSYLDPLYRSSYVAKSYKCLTLGALQHVLHKTLQSTPPYLTTSSTVSSLLDVLTLFLSISTLVSFIRWMGMSLSSSSNSSSSSLFSLETQKTTSSKMDYSALTKRFFSSLVSGTVYFIHWGSMLICIRRLGVFRSFLFTEFFLHWIPFFITQLRSDTSLYSCCKITRVHFVGLSILCAWLIDIFVLKIPFSSLPLSWFFIFLTSITSHSHSSTPWMAFPWTHLSPPRRVRRATLPSFSSTPTSFSPSPSSSSSSSSSSSNNPSLHVSTSHFYFKRLLPLWIACVVA
ncbi:hypothetical protein HMI54_010157, partial [Coelomomyces lativittatus]